LTASFVVLGERHIELEYFERKLIMDNNKIIAFLKTAEQGTIEDYEQRLQDLFQQFEEEDGIAFMLANRLLLIEKPMGFLGAPPRWLSRLKKMAHRLGA
jgi:hypothetical protein